MKMKASPAKRNSKYSGSSTRNTNLIDSKQFNSPYMSQLALRDLTPNRLSKENSAGEVLDYEYKANENEQEEGVTQPREVPIPQALPLSKNMSAPLNLISHKKCASFHDNQLSSHNFNGIEEDEMEDTLRSASPNIDMKNKFSQHKMSMWKTHKHLSMEDHNEISERCNDYDQIEIYNGYAETINKAMSENNVGGFMPRKSSKFNHLRYTHEDLSSLTDEVQSEIYQNENTYEEQDHKLNLVKQNTYIEQYNNESEGFAHPEYDEIMSMDKRMREKRQSAQPKQSTNQTNSVVDIDTVGGKTVIRKVTEEQKQKLVRDRLRKFLII